MEQESKTQNLYDRIADVHDLMMKVNGYRDSVANYLTSLDLKLDSDALVLDAGCGTGLVTRALYNADYRPKKTVALDLSFNSLVVAKEQFEKDEKVRDAEVETIQGNLLELPFENEKFDLVLTCGALEYVPLGEGLAELARVLKKDAILVVILVRPSIVGSVLEILYDFKTHPIEEIKKASEPYFSIVDDYKFPITDPIGWSKILFLLRRK